MKRLHAGSVSLVMYAIIVIAAASALAAQQSQLAPTPPMGWNDWYQYECKVSDSIMRANADALVSNGMKAAGYVYVNIDDCWQGKRDEKGFIHPNERFPDMKALGDYIHSKGLKFGIYSSPGPKTCGGYEGSYKHEEQDAQTYAQWGVDFVKYDWCSAAQVYKPEEMQGAYRKMHDALKRTGRPMVYSLCQYGLEAVWRWGPKVGGNMWRTTDDIGGRLRPDVIVRLPTQWARQVRRTGTLERSGHPADRDRQAEQRRRAHPDDLVVPSRCPFARR